MRAHVHLRLPDGSRATLGPGDMIGRTWTAALRLDDPGVSEAHALVSLRGESLQLLALRGRFLVDGQPAGQAVLVPGQRVRLSQETELVVEAVALPREVLALEGDGLPRQVLAGVCSLRTVPHPRLLPGHDPGAEAVLWSTGEGWRLRIGPTPPRELAAGDAFTVSGRPFRAVAVALAAAAQEQTRVQGGVDAPVRVEARFDTVHLHREGAPVAVLSGHAARVVSELVALGGPAPWSVVAGEIWPGEDDRDELRRKWDVVLVRLRHRLRGAGVRPDLVRSSRSGQVELVLLPGDAVEDRT